jgi:hypothetical protein
MDHGTGRSEQPSTRDLAWLEQLRPTAPTHPRGADVGSSRAAAVERVVRLALGALVACGAVAGAAELMRHWSPSAALAWLVALTAAAHAVVAVWMSMTGILRLEDVVRAGAWATCLLVLQTLALTSFGLYSRVIAVLAALALVALRLDRR